jgi:transposase-like protein
VLRTYDAAFRRRVVELVRAGRPVRVVAAELSLAEATVYRWKAQDLIDRGVKPGTSTSERGELAAARQRIKELETELALVKQAAKLFEEGLHPKPSTRSSLNWPGRASRPSDAAAFSAWLPPVLHVAAPVTFTTPAAVRLADGLVRAIHANCRGAYGWRRVNAEDVPQQGQHGHRRRSG